MAFRSLQLVMLCLIMSTSVSGDQYDVRLGGSTTPGQGYVEVFYDGRWGTVCKDGWDFLDAFVVCRQLGFGWVSYRGWEQDYGSGSGPAWLSNVQCLGSELSLADCANDGWSEHNCSTAAAVSCGSIDGYSSAKGYVANGFEVYYAVVPATEGNAYLKFEAAEYYALPDYSWSFQNADVFCRYMTLPRSDAKAIGALEATNGSYFGRHADKQIIMNTDSLSQLPVKVLPVEFFCQGDEASLGDCPAEALPDDAELVGRDAGVKCQLRNEPENFQIRLVGGSTPLEGRVEVFYGGSWGSVQYGSNPEMIAGQDTTFADVVCRQLNYGYPAVVSRDGRFGRSSTDIKMEIFGCTGAESSLSQCGLDLNWAEKTGQGFNLSIVCSGPVDPDAVYPRLYFSASKVLPAWPFDDDTVQAYGKLQVFHDGRFGTVCNEGWTMANSRVACRQMGYGPPEDTLDTHYERVISDGPIYLDGVACKGDKTSLDQCVRGDWMQTPCNHSQDVIMTCYFQPDQYELRITNRLYPGSTQGQLQVFYNETWGYICREGWDFEDAIVACRKLGFDWIFQWETRRDPVRDDPVWLSDLQCDGHEASLELCPNDGWKAHPDCATNVASVDCQNTEGYKGAKAYFADGLGDSGVVSEGTAMFYLTTGEISGVCGEEWDLNDAIVFCRQLKMYSAEAANNGSAFGMIEPQSGLSPIPARQLVRALFRCSGSESSLRECPAQLSRADSLCWPVNLAGVRCLRRQEPEGFNVRLTGGNNDTEGRVEVFYGGSWGSVGSDVNLTHPIRYGDVICRQLDLGYAKNTVSASSEEYGSSTLPVKMTGVWCAGSESSLAQCGPNVKWVDTANDSLKGDNTGIVCSGKVPDSRFALRLSPESSLGQEGYLEIFQDGRFFTVCDDTWTDNIGKVVCRQLGLGSVGTLSETVDVAHSGPVFKLDFTCDGSESSLDQCEYEPSGYGDNVNCDHSRDVYIKCTTPGASTPAPSAGSKNLGVVVALVGGILAVWFAIMAV